MGLLVKSDQPEGLVPGGRILIDREHTVFPNGSAEGAVLVRSAPKSNHTGAPSTPHQVSEPNLSLHATTLVLAGRRSIQA